MRRGGIKTRGWGHNCFIPETLKQLGIDGDGIEGIEVWKTITKKGELYDEYGAPIKYEHFWRMVENLQSNKIDHGSGVILVDGYDFLFREFS